MSLSAGQISLLRTEPQISRPYLALLQPATIFACQVNDTFTTSDMTVEFEFDNVTTGAYSDVIPGMIIYIGSTAGAYDIGIGRARKAFGATTAYIGEVSDIAFDNDLYVTVVDAFEVNPRHLVVTSDGALMDVDIAYTDQHENYDPVPIMGGQVVVDTDSYPVTINFPEVANSWVIGSTITGYSFTATEGAVSNGTTSNPSVTISSYPTNGYIRVAETVTAGNGASHTGYRYILVFDPDHRPIEDFELRSCSASRSNGGWSARVKLNNESDVALLREGSLVIIYSRDYFDNSEDVVGLYAGRENIWISGWVYQYAKDNDPEHEPGEFEIQNAAFWMSQMSAFAAGVEFVTGTPTTWTEMQLLTVDKALFHFFRWRSTVMEVMDVFLSDDTRYTLEAVSAAGSLWGQIKELAEAQIYAQATCNYNCMLAVRIPYNLIPSADRAAASTKVMDLTTQDFNKNVSIARVAPKASMIVLSGVAVDIYGNGTATFSLSPGHVPARLGDMNPAPNLLLEDQTQANILAGLRMAAERNPYPDIPLVMKGHNRAFDICPTLYGTVTGLTDYSGTIIPEEIDYEFQDGRLTVEISFAGETDENDAVYVNGDIPDGEGGADPIDGGYGDYEIPELPPLPNIEFPPTIPPFVTTDCVDYITNFFPLMFDKKQLVGADSDKLTAYAPFQCTIRGDNAYAPTYIDFSAFVAGDAASYITVYGVKDGNRIITASLASGIGRWTFRAYFNPVSDTLVDGFEIVLEFGGWTPTADISVYSEFACTTEQVADHIVKVQEQGAGNYAAGIQASVYPTILYTWLPSGFDGRISRVETWDPANSNWVHWRGGAKVKGLAGGWTKPSYYQYIATEWTNIGGITFTTANDHKITEGQNTSTGIITNINYSTYYYVIAGTLSGEARYVDLYAALLHNVCAP